MAADSLPSSAKIAIVGIGCRFANGINNTEDFRRMLYEGLDCTSAPPDGRYDMTHFYSLAKCPGKMYNQKGGYLLGNLEAFDREFFRISPEEANALDPQVRLLLEVAYESLENAGIPLHKIKGTNTGVYMGVTANEYLLLSGIPNDNISQYTNSGTNSCMVANRLSYEFDLRGPSFSVDTACSSSLYAIHLACEAIRQGNCNMAIAGGVNLLLTPITSIGFCQAGMLAPDGRCKSFDNSADGYSRSEGAGIVVLKPLEKALEDGDNIYAVIRGGALSNDGHTPGIANPSYDAQTDLVYRACRRAQVHPHQVEYIEAHGTGTKVGDKTEANALGEALSKTRSKDERKLYIGSVKSNFGHTEGAAGVAGIIKVALMQYHNIIPPVVHFRKANENIPLDELNLVVPKEVVNWSQPKKGQRRLAGCSSFGFGGANAHLILEEPPMSDLKHRPKTKENTILFLSAASKDALLHRKFTMSQELQEDETFMNNYYGFAATSFHRATHHRYRCGIIAKSAADAATMMSASISENIIEGTAANAENLPGIAFVFTGMGSQWWAMGRTLYVEDNTFRNTIRLFDDEMQLLGASWTMSELLTQTNDKDLINNTAYAQPAICAVEMGLVDVLREYKIVPDVIVGHSVGEVAAAYASNRITFKDAVSIIYYRGSELSKTSGKGTMLAVLHTVDEVRSKLNVSRLRNKIDIAVINSPTQVVLSGDVNAINEFKTVLEQEGIRSVPLKVNNAFHSFQQEPLQNSLKQKLSFLTQTSEENDSHIPMVSSVTGTYVSTKQLNDSEYWWNNVRRSVNFQAAFDVLLRDGYTTFLEIGAHPALGPAMRDTIQSQRQQLPKVIVLGTLKRPKDASKPSDDHHLIMQCLTKLHCEGYPVDFSRLYPEKYHVQRLPLYPWQRVNCSAVTDAATDLLLHPRKQHCLLGKKEDRSEIDRKYVWNSELSVQTVPWVREHIIQSNVIAPGTSYLEIMLEATTQLQEKNREVRSVRNIDLKKFLFMPDCKATLRVQVVQDDDQMQLSIMSRGGKNTWSTHATSTLCLNSEPDDMTKLDIRDIRSKCASAEAKQSDFLYTLFTQLGYNLGPSFKNITHSWFNDSLNVAYMRISASNEIRHELDQYNIHPALFDSCWQGLGVTLMLIKQRQAKLSKTAYQPKLLVPLYVKEMWLFRSVPAELFAKVEVQLEEPMTAEITIINTTGELCLVLRGALFGMASEVDEGQEAQLWQFGMEEKTVHDIAQPVGNGRVLAIYQSLTDEKAFINHSTAGVNMDTESITTLQENHCSILDRHHDVNNIVYFTSDEKMWSQAGTYSQTNFKVALNSNHATLTKVIKQLRRFDREKPTLWLLTRGAVPVCEGDPCSPMACAIQSFGISMMQEAIDIKVYMVDLPQDDNDFHSCLSIVHKLIANPPQDENELVISCAGGTPKLYARRLGHYPPSKISRIVKSDQWAIEDDTKSRLVTVVPCSNVATLQDNRVRIQVKAMKILEGQKNGTFRAIVAGPVITKLNGYKTLDNVVGFTSSDIHAYMDLDPAFCAKVPGKMDCSVAINGIHRYLTAYIVASVLDVRKKTVMMKGGNDTETCDFNDVIKILGGNIVEGGKQSVDFIIALSMRDHAIPKSYLRQLKCFGKVVSVTGSDDAISIPMARPNTGFSSLITISRSFHPNDDIARYLHDFMSNVLKKVLIHVSPKHASPVSLGSGIRNDSGHVLTMDRANIEVQLQMKGNVFVPNINACYVVVGASRGFGIEILQWLSKSGVKNIIAVSRSYPQGDDKEKVQQIQDSGTKITWHEADITDRKQVLGVLKSAKNPVEGIFHAAAVYQDKWLDSLEEDDWHAVFMPKAYGAFLLHQIADELRLPLKYFVMFSSITSLMGSAGQANYCAANSFLLGLGSFRRSQGLPATVASMGVINTTGFAARNDLVETWENKGMGSLSPTKILDIIGMMMMLDIPHLGMTGFFNSKDYFVHLRPQVSEHLKEPEGAFSRWKQVFTKELLEEGNKGISQSLRDETPTAAKEIIRTELVSFLAERLGIADPESITSDSAPVAYGLDSLMAPDMSAHISELFHISVLPVELLNDKSSVGKLVLSIFDKIMANSANDSGKVGTESESTPILVASVTVRNPNSVLVCFPPNGGGPSTYFDWNTWAVDNNVQMYVVQFPGWEGSSETKPLRDFGDIISLTTKEVVRAVKNQKFSMYGHSFGALIAYEVAHQLRSEHNVTPSELFVGAWYSPVDPYGGTEEIPPGIFDQGTPIEKAIEMARRFKFLDEDVLKNKNIMRRMLPCIDVSLAICKSYIHEHGNKLPCNMTAYAGTGDRVLPPVAIKRWSAVAHPGFTFNCKVLEGRHLFILEKRCREAITNDILKSLCDEVTQL